MENILIKRKQWAWDAFLVLSASIILFLSNYLKIPLFFSPVPLVVQNSMAIAFGILLGPKKGSLSVLLFLFYSWVHVSVTGASFVTGGYLLGYYIAAYVIGMLYENKQIRLFTAILLGHSIILLLGTLFLSALIGWKQSLLLGLLPFIGVDFVKSIFLFKFLHTYKK